MGDPPNKEELVVENEDVDDMMVANEDNELDFDELICDV